MIFIIVLLFIGGNETKLIESSIGVTIEMLILLANILLHNLIVITNGLPKLDGNSVLVDTKQGALVGRVDTDYWHATYFSFEGIPYAKPPVGELRFKAPREPDPWGSEIFDAKKPGNACVQYNGQGSEDCLTLNIYTKMVNDNETLRPVMVWIHGGAFVAGSASNAVFGPDFLVHEDIVLVKIQYRLNVFGFLSLDDEDLEVSGNAALKDQVMALKWVQQNIENFGGDPQSVTIFGESAGGASTHLLNLSPMAKGLFHNVISQSGCALNPWVSSAEIPGKQYFDEVGCSHDDLKMVLECLQEASIQKLIAGQNTIKKEEPFFGVVIEKSTKEETFLSESIETILEQGKFNHIPFISGYVPDEGIFLSLLGVGLKPGENALLKNYIPKTIDVDVLSEKGKLMNNQIIDFYFANRSNPNDVIDGYLKYLMDYMILEKLYTVTKIQANKSTAPVYFYKFNYDTSLNLRVANFPKHAITHADDVGYLFTANKTPRDLPDDSVEIQAVKHMVKLWTTFAKTGNPNGIEEPIDGVEWKPVTKDHFYYLEIQQDAQLLEDPEKDRIKFWEDFNSQV